MTGKLMRAVGRRSQFLTSWASTGLHEYLHDVAADSPEREIHIDYGTYEICFKFE